VHHSDGSHAPLCLLQGDDGVVLVATARLQRNRDEMVCRLFLTRWWTSRTAASLLRTRRLS